MGVWVRLSLVHFKGRSRKSSFRTYLDRKLFRSMTDLTPLPGSCQPFQGNESHNVHPPQRLRMVTSLLERLYGLCLLFWSIPNVFVYSRGDLALIFRHSSHGKGFAAE